MTRDFNKQQRDDSRPSFRDRSSNNNAEDRSAYPARPRLNRETVDRAWESGAQQKHADYHARSTNGQPPRNNWRNQQPSEHSSSQNGHGGTRPYNTRQEPYRDNSRNFERTSDDSNGTRSPRARSFNSNNAGRQPYDNARPTERRPYDNARPAERRPYDNARPNERPYSPGARPDQRRDGNRPDNRDHQFRGQEQGRDNRRPPFERNERPFSNERRGPGAPYNQRPETRNPRLQSRNWARREASPEEMQEHSSRASSDAQFEGDYEHFNKNDNRPGARDSSYRGSRPEGPFKSRPPREREESPAQERHVTQLPDGRVLKGPRPAQRQEARFWTEVSDDTESLVKRIQSVNTETDAPQGAETAITADAEAVEIPTIEADGVASDSDEKSPKKSRTRSASATVRSRKAGAPKEKTKTRGPRPSQRGYQWPSP